MTILFLSLLPLLPSKGGIERVSVLLGNQLKSKGHTVAGVVVKHPEEKDMKADERTANSLENNGDFPKYYLDPDRTKRKEEFLNIVKDVKPDVIINQMLCNETFDLLDYLNKEKESVEKPFQVISVLHNRPFNIEGIGRKLKQLTYPITLKGKVLKYTGIIFPVLYSSARKKYARLNFKRFLEVSDKLYFLSERYIPRFREFMPEIKEDRLDAVCNPNTFELPTKVNANKENLVIFVGRLEDPQKNVKGFIDVWNIFRKTNPGWKAIIIGDGPHRKIFEDYARKRGSQDLEFVGNSKKVAEYYDKAKFLCMTSLYEGWPMVLAESIAYGCVPLVYDTFETVSEILDNGRNGVVCEHFKPDKMAKRLEKIARNDSERNKMINAGREYITGYNLASIADIWEEKLERLISNT